MEIYQTFQDFPLIKYLIKIFEIYDPRTACSNNKEQTLEIDIFHRQQLNL